MTARAPRVALITTTINVPTVLSLYRAYDPSVAFFVIADRKTPVEAADFCSDLGNCHYISVEDQEKLDYKCLKHIPWNSITRRNIALLEALKWGAEVIVTIDDDNIPLSRDYFRQFVSALTEPFDGLVAESPTGWFDPGALLIPKAPHRGFPLTQSATPKFSAVTGARVGVVAGMCLGDPDISAVERMANHPMVYGASAVLQAGVVVDPRKTWTVFNTQNTAFVRELAPAMLLCSQHGRFDDIMASLIAQKFMAKRNLHARFGNPFVHQERNSHDLVRDLKAEMWGMQNIESFADTLRHDIFCGGDKPWIPLSCHVSPASAAKELAVAWLYDIEDVM